MLVEVPPPPPTRTRLLRGAPASARALAGLGGLQRGRPLVSLGWSFPARWTGVSAVTFPERAVCWVWCCLCSLRKGLASFVIAGSYDPFNLDGQLYTSPLSS